MRFPLCKIFSAAVIMLPATAVAQKVAGTMAFEDSVAAPYKVTLLEGGRTLRTVISKDYTGAAFELPTPKAGEYVLRITSKGYSPYEIKLKTRAGETFNLGQVTMTNLSGSLGTATVTYKRPLVKNDGTKTTISVKGTYLGRTGNVSDMLAKAPGLIKTPNGIEVAMYGKPVFELDGRIVSENEVLKVVKASDVDKVEIDKVPGPRYPVGTKVVVRVKSSYDLKDNIYLDVSNDVGMKQRVSEAPSVNFKIKKGKLTARTNARWSAVSGNLNQETYTTEIYHPDYTYSSVESSKSPSYSRGVNALQGLEWRPNDSIMFTALYTFYYSNNRSRNIGELVVNDKDRSYVRSKSSLNNSFSNYHNASLLYQQDFKKYGQTLRLTADYSNQRYRTTYSSVEANQGEKATTVRSPRHYRYDIFTGKAIYWVTLPGKISSYFGADYDYVRTPYTQSVFRDDALSGMADNTTHDHNVAAYANLFGRWKYIRAQIGARYEYEYTRVWAGNNGQAEKTLNTFHDSQLTPYATVMFYKSDELPSVRFDYTRRANRVSYKNLISTPVYRDSLYYEQGNVDLLPMVYNSMRLSLEWKDISISASYYKYKNYITSASFNLDQSNNVITYMPFNLPRYSYWSADVSYSKQFGKFNMYVSGGLFQGHSHITFQDKTELINKLQWTASTNLNYNFNDNWSAYASFNYESRSRDVTTFLRSRNSLNLGISGTLLKDRLSISLDASDLLRGQNYNRITDRLYNVMSKTDGYNDFRGVKLSLTYTLFNKSIQVRAIHSNSEILQRTN